MAATKFASRRGGLSGAFITAAMLGAAWMYFFDPNSGRRRRARLGDQLGRARRSTQRFAGKVERDAAQRMRGLYRAQVARFSDDDADDRVIAERVRATLGRLTSHPGPIYVTARDGVVWLRGDVLKNEASAVVRGAQHVRGVSRIVNELRVHDEAGRISALQGQGSPRTSRFEYLQANWSPAPRVLASAAGLALTVGGLASRTRVGYALAAGGAVLIARSLTNRPLSHVMGVQASDADGVRVQKTIEVYAEVEEVYTCWRDLECFPRFMSHVRDVQKINETRYRWTVDGPAGMPVMFEAEITADVPGELIAWRTVDSTVVHSSGVVHFEPTRYGGTRVNVHMSYRPVANLVGHAVAKMFARDPKQQLDDDLLRFKNYIELGGGVSSDENDREPREPIQH